MSEKITGIISTVVWGLFVFCSLYDSEKTQKIVLAYCKKHPFQTKYNPFYSWMKTPSYLKSLKKVGLISCVGLILSLLFLIAAFNK